MIPVGTVIENYRILKLLGVGSYSYVHLAQHVDTNVLYAIKQIKENLTQQDQKTIDREVNVLMKIKHPSIVHFHNQFYTGKTRFMVFEHCSKGDLDKLMRQKHAWFSERTVRMIVAQICQAFKSLHAAHIVHRDLKLANILLTEHYDVKLADFGFSKEIENSLLQTKCGTPITMAPQILQQRTQYKENCDTWSLGVITYQMLFNRYPWFPTKKKQKDLLHQIKSKELVFPKCRQISSHAQALVRRCLDKNPETRPTIEMICSDLWIRQGLQDLHQGYTLFSCYNPIRQHINKSLKSLFGKYWFGQFKPYTEKIKAIFSLEEDITNLIGTLVSKRRIELEELEIKLIFLEQQEHLNKSNCVRLQELLDRWRLELQESGYQKDMDQATKLLRKGNRLLIKCIRQVVEDENNRLEKLKYLQYMADLVLGKTLKTLSVRIEAVDEELQERQIRKWTQSLRNRLDKQQDRIMLLKMGEDQGDEEKSEDTQELQIVKLILDANKLFAEN